MSKDTLLTIKNLNISFTSENKQIQAVKGISFQIKRGETLGVVGESGSGKSVTALSLMNLVPNPPGKVEAEQILLQNRAGEEKNLQEQSPKEWQQIRGSELAMIFQEPMSSLNPVYTCGDQIMEAILLHQKLSKKEAKDKVFELFEKVQLHDAERIFKAYPHQLSGGQKQRVMIAMAISCQPTLLIADEPTTALDVTVQKAILKLLNDLKKDLGVSILFISHDLGVIAELADRVVVMYQGEIVEQGTVKEVFQHPKHPYTKGLLACRPPLKQKLKRLPVIEDFLSEEIIVRDRIKELVLPIDEEKKRMTHLKEQVPILKVSGLKTWFPSNQSFWGKTIDYVKAVDDVSFDVYPGETMGLVGESGSGKTTLGRTLLRLQAADAGSIHFEGKEVLKLEENELSDFRKQAQIIFQDPFASLNPRISIGHAIMEPMKVHHIGENDEDRRERSMQLLETVQLERGFFNRFPFELSGGQRQRIGIARALAVEPKFMICDESVSALDVSIQAQILNLLLDLQQQKQLTYIFISHDLSVVKFMSDRMMVMQHGKIVEMGEASKIYEQAQSPYTQQLIDAIPKGF